MVFSIGEKMKQLNVLVKDRLTLFNGKGLWVTRGASLVPLYTGSIVDQSLTVSLTARLLAVKNHRGQRRTDACAKRPRATV